MRRIYRRKKPLAGKEFAPLIIPDERFGFPEERYRRTSVDGSICIAFHYIGDYERNEISSLGSAAFPAGPEGHTDPAEDQYPTNHLRCREAFVQDRPGEHSRAYRLTQYNHRHQ